MPLCLNFPNKHLFGSSLPLMSKAHSEDKWSDAMHIEQTWPGSLDPTLPWTVVTIRRSLVRTEALGANCCLNNWSYDIHPFPPCVPAKWITIWLHAAMSWVSVYLPTLFTYWFSSIFYTIGWLKRSIGAIHIYYIDIQFDCSNIWSITLASYFAVLLAPFLVTVIIINAPCSFSFSTFDEDSALKFRSAFPSSSGFHFFFIIFIYVNVHV